MDSDSLSRFERVRAELYKDADDITDIAEKTGERMLQMIDHPPTENYTAVPGDHLEITAPSASGLEGGQIVVAGIVVGMLGYELAPGVKIRVEAWKGRGHGGK
jgi:hypothetical protein